MDPGSETLPTRPKTSGSDGSGSTPLPCIVYLRRGPGWDEGVDDRLGGVGAHHAQAPRHHVGESLPGLRGVLVPARRVLGRRPPDNSKKITLEMLYPTVSVPVPDKVGQVITIVQELAGSGFFNLIVTSSVANWDSLNRDLDPDQRFDDQKFKKYGWKNIFFKSKIEISLFLAPWRTSKLQRKPSAAKENV